MSEADRRASIEKSLGRKLPFDDAVLTYLLKAAPLSSSAELAELVTDFCPRWPNGAQEALAAQLQVTTANEERPISTVPDPGGTADFGNGTADFGHNFMGTADFGRGAASSNVASRLNHQENSAVPDEQADLLLARMLQEEEEAEAALAGAQQPARSSKARSKKGFRPLNINYTVGHAAAPSALGTAAPSSLADLLRARRSQQGPTAAMAPESFGPPAARAPNNSAWAPVPQGAADGLTWAERAQVAAENAARAEAEAKAIAAAQSQNTCTLRLLTMSGSEYKINADTTETVGDIKRRVEKLHKVPFLRQRILYLGRELTDDQELGAVGLREGQYTLQLALRNVGEQSSGPPQTINMPGARTHVSGGPTAQHAAGRQHVPPQEHNLQLKIKLPTGAATLNGIPETSTVGSLKQRIQREHGIRADHQALSFFGMPLENDSTLVNCGIADGGLVDVALRPPGQSQTSVASSVPVSSPSVGFPSLGGGKATAAQKKKNQKGRAQPTDAFDSLQTVNGGVLHEDEALEMALKQSRGDDDMVDICEDDPSGSLEDEEETAYEDNGFYVDVSIQEDRLQPMITHAKRIAGMHYREDLISKVSKRSGFRLTLLAEKTKKPKTVLGYAVFRFRAKVMTVFQCGVAGEHRGQGVGRRLLSWVVSHAKRANLDQVKLVSPQGSAKFYQSLGFRLAEVQSLEGEAVGANEVVMEYHAQKGRQRVGNSSGNARQTATASGGTGGTRPELVKKLFQLCDRDRDGALNNQEMYKLAVETGFDGTEEDWGDEYEILCKENGRSPLRGVDEALLQKLINDESDRGIYCTDDEIRNMVSKLSHVASVVSNVSTDANRAEASSRQSQVRRLFALLDVDQDGYLSMQEMHAFARETGFDGSMAEWKEEYEGLVQEFNAPPLGIDVSLLERLVDDESGSGCHCTDEEIRQMASRLEASRKTTSPTLHTSVLPASHPPQGERVQSLPQAGDAARVEASNRISGAQNIAEASVRENVDRTVDDTAKVSGRKMLIREVFDALDLDANGRLCSSEMRVFGDATGFEGADVEWAQEFQALCKEGLRNPEDGVDFELFLKLVEDDSDNGCYCTDAELRQMIDMVATKRRPAEASAPSQLPTGGVNNRSPDEEAPFFLEPPREEVVPKTISTVVTENDARAKLVREVFDVCDQDRDGYLNAREMQPIAEATGFDGAFEEWEQEFALLCKDYDVETSRGFDLACLRQLVDDDSDNGCYCDDSELRSLINITRSRANPPVASAREEVKSHTVTVPPTGGWNPSDVPSVPPPRAADVSTAPLAFLPADRQPATSTLSAPARPGRTELIKAVFRACDVDRDGRLNNKEMHTFATHIGFDGGEQEWADEFKTLCIERGRNAATGVDEALLVELANDTSDSGCYCTDDELRDMLRALFGTVRARMGMAPKPSNSRSELVEQTFHLLDLDEDDVLCPFEMLRFARHIGFSGNTQEWRSEFDLLFRGDAARGRGPADGVDKVLFSALIDDESEDGCYCSDEEIRDMIQLLQEGTRSALIASIFSVCTKDDKNAINIDDFQSFAQLAALIQGLPETWSEKYIVAPDTHSLDQEFFVRLCNGANGSASLTDSSLRAILTQLRAPAPAVPTRVQLRETSAPLPESSSAVVPSTFAAERHSRPPGLESPAHKPADDPWKQYSKHGDAGVGGWAPSLWTEKDNSAAGGSDYGQYWPKNEDGRKGRKDKGIAASGWDANVSWDAGWHGTSGQDAWWSSSTGRQGGGWYSEEGWSGGVGASRGYRGGGRVNGR